MSIHIRLFLLSLVMLLGLSSFAAPGTGGSYRDTACRFSSITVADTGTGTWSALPSNPSAPLIVTPAAGTTVIRYFDSAGVYRFVYQRAATRDTVTIQVLPKPKAGTDIATCQYSTIRLGASGTGLWSAAAANPAPVVFVRTDSATTPVSGFTSPGLYIFYWSLNGCSDTVSVTVTSKPNAGNDVSASCFATGTVSMGASGSGIWSAAANNPGRSNIVAPSNANTVINGFTAPGAYFFVWTVNGCTDTARVTLGAVANDACSTATSLGMLPAPATCASSTSGTRVGATVARTGESSACASASAPFPYQAACPVSITAPPRDVWYSFVASATRATVAVSGAAFQNPVISVWGGNCGTLSGLGCTTGSNGAASLTAYQLTVGNTYFVQVSGPDSTQYGTFDLSINASTDCAGCLVTSTVTASPQPVNGTYYPGQTVSFCYTVTNWQVTSQNWLHGIVVHLGAGWDLATLTPGVPPASCSNDGGSWGWHSGGDTGVATNNIFGAGFYYETTSGSASGRLDGSPGNNFGDNNGGLPHTWVFCITVTSASANCLSGQDLSVSFQTTGDGQSGSWTSLACVNDPGYKISSVGACCPPTVRTTGASCNHNDGTATATPTGTNGPWTFKWSNGVIQTNRARPSTITGLTVDLYTVTVIDIYGCQSTASDSVRPATKPNGGGTKYVSCPQLGDSAVMTAIGTGSWYALANPVPTIIVNPDSANTPVKGFGPPGTYNYVWSIGNCLDTVPVIVTIKPNAGPDQSICNRAIATMDAFGTGTWSALPTNPGPTAILDTLSDSTKVTGFVAGGAYGFIWTTSAGCSDTMFITVPDFNLALTAGATTICQYSNTTITVTPTPASYGPFLVSWIDSNRVQDAHAATTVINSLAQTAWFHVRVTDAAGCTLVDSIRINTTTNLGTDISATGYPASVCPGSLATLSVVANPNSCGLATTPCTGPGTLVTVGTGTGNINGPGSQYPAPYGNYYKSARHQFLIHASEILGQVSSGGQIKSLSLNVGTLNGAAPLRNFTISLACVPDDTMPAGYLGGLTQVYTVGSYTAVSGWNTHTFNTPYNWDGRSNVVVDICFTDSTSGSANPKMQFTQTSFRSVWVTYSNYNGGVCGVPGIQQNIATAYAKYFQRPNMRLNICTTDLAGANLVWTPSTGPNAPSPNNLDTVRPHVFATTTYQVALTSPNGCVNYDFVTISVDTTARLVLTDDTFLCSVQPVRLSATVTGDSVHPAQVTYTWTASTGTAPPSGTGASFATAVVNPAVTTLYTVAITGAGCNLFDSVRVTIGSGLPIAKKVDSITCAGVNNGAINLDINAGIPPYTYTWSPAVSGNIDSAINLAPGTYIVQVTDAQGCNGRDTTRLSAPAPLTLRLDSANVLCYNGSSGSVTATVAGGRAPYRYTWSAATAGNTSSLTGLAAGNYLLTVKDTSGCSISGQVAITQPSQLVSLAVTTNLSGAGTHDGTITITTSGGTPAYTYVSAPSVTGLPAAAGLDTGIYIITICDANSCCVKDTAHISGPPPIVVTPTIVHNLCNGQCSGSIFVTASGGVTPYTYSWSTTPVSTVPSVSNLCAGNYTLIVTDANGISVSNTYIITDPLALGDKIDSTLITCFGASNGALHDSVYGGTSPYTITWSPGGSDPLSGIGPGTYRVSVTDANGCTLSDSASLGQPPALSSGIDSVYPASCYGFADGRAVISIRGGTLPYTIAWSASASADTVAADLIAGTSTVTATDAHGCTTSLTITISQPQQLIANVTTFTAHCATSHDGSASVVASNGNTPYTYMWDNTAAGNTISNLDSGSHTLTVTDSTGCPLTVPFFIDTQYVLHLAMSSTPVTCYAGTDGTASATALNGGPVASYLWSPSATGNPAIALPAGEAYVTVTDNVGCIARDSVLVDHPAPVVVSHILIDPGCTGQATGKILFSATGGTGPYTYLYNGVATPVTDTISGLTAGTYIYAISDAKGCTQGDTVILTDPAQLVLTTDVRAISCANASDGSITAHISGGTPLYSYTWSPAAAADSIDAGLAPGVYAIAAYDSHGCTQAQSVTLTAPPRISFTYVDVDSTSCSYSTDGHIVVNVTGGTPGTAPLYTYAISGQPSQQDSNFNNLAAGVYLVSVTDSQHCSLDTSLTVYAPLPIDLFVDPLDTLLPLGGTIRLSLLLGNSAGQSITSYLWSPADGLSCIDCPAPVAAPYQKQEYTVVMTYGKNCIATAAATIRIDKGGDTYIPNAFTPNGDGANDEFSAFGTGLKSVGMIIFNRWGEKVFDSGDSQWASWDGTYKGVAQPTGVFVYTVTLVYLDGTKKIREGSLTLIR